MSSRSQSPGFHFPSLTAFVRGAREQTLLDALTGALHASHAREETLVREMRALSQRQEMLAQEFEHRLVNGLQLISSLLSLQSRTASTPEASDQLTVAARRVAALGRVHHRLHLLDHEDHVEFRQYLRHLCDDLSNLLFEEKAGPTIVVEAASIEMPTAFAIPLGFIINELVTNSAKYAQGNIVVRFEKSPTAGYSLSILDDGPGLPAGFDPGSSKGLGMRIVRALVQQIGGELHVFSGEDDRGARFAVTFEAPRRGTNGA
jgi:two-component system, sensor histidine kinase PdtaS